MAGGAADLASGPGSAAADALAEGSPGCTPCPDLIGQLPRLEVLSEPDAVTAAVRAAYLRFGRLLDEDSSPALLVDALCHDFPIVGMSRGFECLTGCKRKQMLGRNCRFMLDGVSVVMISKTARRNLQDFCSMCRCAGISGISTVKSLQPNSRQDGTGFMNFFMISLCPINEHRLLLGVQTRVCEGAMEKLNDERSRSLTEECRATLVRLQRLLCRKTDQGPEPSLGPFLVSDPQPDFIFFTQRLHEHCTLFNRNCTALRREPQGVPTGCLVFGDRPVKPSERGLFFSVLVDGIVNTFDGLPLLGFTRRKPVDSYDLYPAVTKCLGASVLIGACGEAFARDQDSNFPVGFKPPPRQEVQAWRLRPGEPWHKRGPSLRLRSGDTLGCLYTHCGQLQLWVNGHKAMDFDLKRPPEDGADYYAVVDVCFSAYSLTILPEASPPVVEQEAETTSDQQALAEPAARCPTTDEVPASRPAAVFGQHRGGATPECVELAGVKQALVEAAAHCPATDEVPVSRPAAVSGQCKGGAASGFVDLAGVKQAIRAAAAKCTCCATVVDSRGIDAPLIAVSDAFEAMTGYPGQEVLGMNCKFLNSGCALSSQDRMGLRSASSDGAPFVALLPNRKRSGERFVNLLDLQGLAVAKSASTGRVLWYCVGFHRDVTEAAHSTALQRHSRERDELVRQVSEHLRQEALRAGHLGERPRPVPNSSVEQYELLGEPYWMDGSELDPSRGSRAGEPPTTLPVTMPPSAAGTWASPNSRRHSLGLRPLPAGSQKLRIACFEAFVKAYDQRATLAEERPKLGRLRAFALTGTLLFADTWIPWRLLEAAPQLRLVAALPCLIASLFLLGGLWNSRLRIAAARGEVQT